MLWYGACIDMGHALARCMPWQSNSPKKPPFLQDQCFNINRTLTASGCIIVSVDKCVCMCVYTYLFYESV